MHSAMHVMVVECNHKQTIQPKQGRLLKSRNTISPPRSWSMVTGLVGPVLTSGVFGMLLL